jgi:hypothetical protein
VTNRRAALQDAVSQADHTAQKLTTDLTVSELATVDSQVGMTSLNYDTDLVRAQSSISSDITKLGNDLANGVTGNRNQFYNQAQVFSQSASDRVGSLRSSVAVASTLTTSASGDAKNRADAVAVRLRQLISTNLQPLLLDVQTAMQNAVTLTAAIDSIRVRTNADLAAVKSSGQQQALALGSQVSSTFAGIKSDFNNKFTAIDTSMQSGINTKATNGRNQLTQIMSGVQSTQGDAAGQQSIQGTVARDQAAASMTAAALVGAQQESAADTTKAGLDTMAGVVGSALQDSQQTLQDVSQANLENIHSLNQKLSANQAATVQTAYGQIQSSDQAASSRNAAVQSDGFDAQLTGQSLEQSLSESGAQLESAVASSDRQAESLLGEINGILALAKQNSGSLEDQMAAFEQQAPALYTLLQQKIAAYKALLVSQGQQAQLAAANVAGSQAQSALGQLAGTLQGFSASAMGVSPSLSSDEHSVISDSASLLRDVQALSGQLQAQSSTGASLVQSTAQAAMTQAASSVKTMSSDSALALGALTSYNTALINQKRVEVSSSGDSVMQAVLDASNYLSDNAKKFVDLSQQYLADAASLGGHADQNLTSAVNTINQTLTDLTTSSDLYLSRLSDAAGSISSWSSEMITRASQINAAIQEKAAEITNTIVEIGNSADASADIQRNLNALQGFIDDLSSTFNKQRESFNEFAKSFYTRRVTLISGLNGTIASQRSQYLQGLTGVDLTEAERTGSSSDTIQGLLTSLEQAKGQGTVDVTQVNALMSKINDGVAGLTNQFASKMGVDLDAMKRKAVKDAILSQQGIGGSVGQAGASAKLLAGNLADALDQIAKSSTAAQYAASGASKDVYSIAGLLQNVGQETQLKVAGLMRALSSGDMTFNDALSAARGMTNREVSTVLDILNVFNSYVTSHVAKVDGFEQAVKDAMAALNTTASQTIGDHVEINAKALADMATQQYKLSSLSSLLLTDSGTKSLGLLDTIKSRRDQAIADMENQLHQILHGSGAATSALEQKSKLVPISRVQLRGRSAADIVTVKDDSSAVTEANAGEGTVGSAISDAISNAETDIASAAISIAQSKSDTDDSISSKIADANAAIADILKITGAALTAR